MPWSGGVFATYGARQTVAVACRTFYPLADRPASSREAPSRIAAFRSEFRDMELLSTVLLCSLAVLDPRVGQSMDVLSPFIPDLVTVPLGVLSTS